MSKAPIEKSIRYATSVATLAEAWAVVMRYVDEVGGPPRIEIRPYSAFSFASLMGEDDADDDGTTEGFEVSVSGMTHVEEKAEAGL